jgi:hypothetical protein
MVPLVVDAECFVCLDADTLVLGPLDPIFGVVDATPEGAILAVREGNGRGWHQFQNLEHALTTIYGGRREDWDRLGGAPEEERRYGLVVNDGVFAATHHALLALDGTIRAMTNARSWVDERYDIWWRNQFVFNLALARLGCGVELHGVFNVQLNAHEVAWRENAGRLEAVWENHGVRVLHFNGLGRNKYPEWRQRFPRAPDLTATDPSCEPIGVFQRTESKNLR